MTHAASAAKLEAALAGLEPDENRRTWLARSAAALAGIEDAAASGEREQAFAAWRQLVEGIAAEQPLVVAFEDIHWADEALLAFIDHLVEHAAGRSAARAVHRSAGAARGARNLGRRQAKRRQPSCCSR